MDALPPAGIPVDEVLAELTQLRRGDLPTHGGRLFAYVFDPAVPGLDDLTAQAYALSAHTNGLDPTAFPSILAMENMIVGAAARLLQAPETVVGNLTSGGTESVLLAVKAARDSRPALAHPRMVVPSSAHPAFAKAASYLRVALDVVPVDPETLRVPVEDMANAISPSTVLVVCSAPAYPYGIVDPVPEIAHAASERGVRCHVDACFGGWLLPYWRRLGVTGPDFDFSVPGVTSISVDLHKYGYSPKGVSVLLHRDAAHRTPQYFGYADWPGYTMVNATVASTRGGGPIAAAWATLRHIGDAGYLDLASRTLDAVRSLAAAVSAVEALRLLPGSSPDSPEASVVAFTSADPELDVFVLADELAARGWHVQPQMSYDGVPASVHLSVTAAVAPHTDAFADALGEAVAAARAHGAAIVPTGIGDLLGRLDPAALTPELVRSLASGLGFSADSAPPERMAAVNAVLDAAPPALRARLLVAFMDLLQRPHGR